MIRAAGVIFIADKSALFVKRSDAGDHPGEWCFPGGKIEPGESAMEAAKRECVEEIGAMPKGTLVLHSRKISTGVIPGNGTDQPEAAAAPSVDFTTFVMRVKEQFTPTLNEEHTGYAWAPLSSPPEPLHPGCRLSIAKMSMNEYDIARAIMVGDLTSPQRYMNVSLYAMRITGTGTAYRKAHDEYVYRRPEMYLTEQFLSRCNGLPVILEHPKKATLDSKEFSDRAVGTIILPYIRGDEVWGIAKIYDDAVIEMMEEQQLSTSPAVVFRGTDGNTELELDGQKILIEGEPALLDHLAICAQGVWDKGGDPAGIEIIKGDSAVDKELLAAITAAVTQTVTASMADVHAKMDSVMTRVDSVDAELKARKDADEKAEKERDDAARADAKKKADEEEEEKKKSDAAKADGAKKDADCDDKDKKADASKKDNEDMDDPDKVAADKAKKDAAEEEDKKKADSALTERIRRDVQSMLPKARSDEDVAKFAATQARADAAFSGFGKSAPRALDGESLNGYRVRLASQLQSHSAAWKGVDLAKADSAVLDIAEAAIYADAATVARNPISIQPGELRQIIRSDDTGRRISEFYGEPKSWMSQFTSPGLAVKSIRTDFRHH